MSLSSRIKERREQLKLSRIELAEKIGVTPSAIANYENEVSSPKVELLYKLFDALECDANYLYQDETKRLTYKDKSTPEEFENIIKKYRDLDDHGREMVDFTLKKEWERSTTLKNNIVEMQEHLVANAANTRQPTAKQKYNADHIMIDDDEWK